MSMVSKVNVWLLGNSLFAYLCYIATLIYTGTIGTGTAIGVAATAMFSNGFFIALSIFAIIFILLWLIRKIANFIRRWSDGMLDRIADKIAKRMKKKDD